mgnify:CR=1 FL=1
MWMRAEMPRTWLYRILVVVIWVTPAGAQPSQPYRDNLPAEHAAIAYASGTFDDQVIKSLSVFLFIAHELPNVLVHSKRNSFRAIEVFSLGCREQLSTICHAPPKPGTLTICGKGLIGSQRM